MEYLNNLRSNFQISNIVNYFFPKMQSEEKETINFIKYKDFMINENVESIDNLKNIIDNFHILNENFTNKTIEYLNLPNLTLKESIYSLDILISRPDIMDFLAKNENDYTEEVVSVISKLYLNIFKIYNDDINNEEDIIKQAQLNFDLCEIIIKYTFIYTHPAFSKFFLNLWKYNVKKYYLLAKNNGCLISWITFSILSPSLVNNNCYPIINKESLIFKRINWEYVKSKIGHPKYGYNKLNLFIKYYIKN